MNIEFKNAKLVLITDEKQRLYFTGYQSTDGYLMIADGEITLVIDNRYFHAASEILTPKGINVVLGAGYSILEEKIKLTGAKDLGVDFGIITAKEYFALKDLGVNLVDVSQELAEKMSIKTEEEAEYIKIACDIAEKSFFDTLPMIKKGVTEREVANVLEFNFKKYGASGTSFDTIVAFGKNSAIPHHQTGDTKLLDDQCVLMDFGCVYKGYCSDMTRTMFYGNPSKEFTDAYQATYEAHINAYNGIEEGMTGQQADALARDTLKKYGYAEYFTHSLGHGIGVNIHEFPGVSPKSQAVLKNGMVFSIEPGVYFNDKFGIRIEDSCILKDGKPSSFMKDGKKLIILK